MRTANGAMGLPHYPPDPLSHPWRARPPVPLPPFLIRASVWRTSTSISLIFLSALAHEDGASCELKYQTEELP